MFCYQCQETALNKGCTVKGVCGKSSEVANLQDLLIFLLKGISIKAENMRKMGMTVPDSVNRFVANSLFMTITNANFDKQRFVIRIKEAIDVRNSLKVDEPASTSCDCLQWQSDSVEEMDEKAKSVGVLHTENEDIRSLRELITYGVKGMAAYADHACNLGYEDEDIYRFMQMALAATTQDLEVDKLVNMVIECGQYGVKVVNNNPKVVHHNN